MMQRPWPVARAEAYRNAGGPALGIEALIIADTTRRIIDVTALLQFANARVIYAQSER